jgi:hypothetical protein
MDHNRNRGFSLIEVIVVLTVLFMTVGMVVLVSNANTHAYQTGATSAELESKVAIAMDRIVAELRMVGRESLDPDPVAGLETSSLRYVKAESYGSGETTWSTLRQLEFEHEPGELDDGLDNNGNGLVDEGRVVLTEDLGGPNERRLVLVRWVSELHEGELPNLVDDNGNGLADEPGFVVERVGATLVVRLSLRKNDSQGFPITRTAQTSAKMRN